MIVDRVFVGQDTRTFIGRGDLSAGQAERALFERRRARDVLSREGDSWARPAGGVVAWLADVVGGAGLAVGLWSGAPVWRRVVAPLAGLVLALAAGAVGARVFLFRGWRLVVSVAAIVSPLAFVVLALEGGPRYQPTWQDGQGPAVAVFVLVLAIAGIAAGVAVFGGLFRMNRAHAERDPVQRRLLGRDG